MRRLRRIKSYQIYIIFFFSDPLLLDYNSLPCHSQIRDSHCKEAKAVDGAGDSKISETSNEGCNEWTDYLSHSTGYHPVKGVDVDELLVDIRWEPALERLEGFSRGEAKAYGTAYT